MKQLFRLSLLCLVLIFGGCRKGEPLDNLSPETSIFVTSINLTGLNRLTSQVELHWSGTDQDGFVKGYEISFDNQNWFFTNETDSTFLFDLTGGVDTLDLDFWVRAIDGADLRDPSPAYLKIPIRNSPPEVKLDSTLALQDTAHIVFSLIYDVSDPDGEETLDSVFVQINNGGWYAVDPLIRFLTFVPQNPAASGQVDCDVWKNLSPSRLSLPMTGLRLNDTNRVYIKARDKAGSWSETDTSKVFFVRKKSASLLVLDSHTGTTSPTPEEVYMPLLNAVTSGYDYIDLTVAANVPPVPDPTLGFILNSYSSVFWYTDESQIEGSHHLEFFSAQIQRFLNGGGKAFITTKFPVGFDSLSTVFGFSPMDSLSSSAGQARIATDSLAEPQGTFAASLDTLKASAFTSGADPFYPQNPADVFYTAHITRVGGWSGPQIIAARTTNAGKTNQVFFSVELHNLNGNPSALQQLFDYVLNNEFNW